MKARTWVLLGVLAAVAVAGGVVLAQSNAPPPGEGGVTGRFWLKDDTGMPDSPASGGRLLVVPGVTVEGLWPDDLDASNSTGPWYTTLVARFDLDQLEEQYGATVVDVADNGRFRVVTPPGPTVICDIGTGGISGCSDVDLPEHGTLRADAGEFGFRIVVE